MNQQQTKHLKERLQKAKGNVSAWRMKNPDMPTDVKKAQAVLNAWETKMEKLREARHDKMRNAVMVVEEAIFFGDPAKALAALKHFEGLRF